jgi:hypothetical protein
MSEKIEPHDEANCATCTGKVKDRTGEATDACDAHGLPGECDHGYHAQRSSEAPTCDCPARNRPGYMHEPSCSVAPEEDRDPRWPNAPEGPITIAERHVDPRSSDDPLRELARKAVEAQDARKDEDVDAWAARLAADSVATGEAEYGPDYPSNRRSETATVDHLKCDVACSLECDAVNRFGDVKIERPRPGRIRIIRRFRSRKDEQVEVDEAWLIDVLRRPTATDPPVRNKPYDFAERARFFVDRVQSGWATGEQRMQGIIDLANMFCEVANVAREDAEQGARRRERATDPEQARNDALDEAAKVAVDEELWTEEPGRLSEFERRIVVGALQSVARGIRALKRERAAPSSSDPKEGG